MKTIRTLSKAVVVAFGMMAIAVPVAADEAKGLEIAKERKVRDQGWGDSVAEMTMLLENANGDTSDRKLRIKTLEVEGDVIKA